MEWQALCGLLVSYGFIGLMLLALAEKFLPMFPSAALLLFIGMRMAPEPQSLVIAVVATTIGSTLGALGWYALGRAVDPDSAYESIEWFGRHCLITRSRYDRIVVNYRENDFLTTFIGQLLPMARVYIGYPAGVVGMPMRPFLMATALGALTWNTPFLLFGHLVQSGHLERMAR